MTGLTVNYPHAYRDSFGNGVCERAECGRTEFDPIHVQPVAWAQALDQLEEWADDGSYSYPCIEGEDVNPETMRGYNIARHYVGSLLPTAKKQDEEEAQASTRPEIVCLSGSSRFVDRLATLAWELEKQGKIVLSMHLLPLGYPDVQAHHQAEHEGAASILDEVHLRKIDLADRVLVCNYDGYVGESTRREIEYALSKGKPVDYLERAA